MVASIILPPFPLPATTPILPILPIPGIRLANHSPNFISPSVFAGVRSWISPHSSVWLELGYGYTAWLLE